MGRLAARRPAARSFPGPAGLLHAVDWGGEGTAVLLLHGMSANVRWWDGVAPLLHGLRPIALDLRGHGDSGWSDDPAGYAFERFPEDVEAARREFGLERFAIAAHSFGARVALEYAAGAPPGLERLSALDFLCEVPPGAVARFTRARARVQPYYATRGEVEERFRLHPPGTLLGSSEVRAFAPACVKEDGPGRWTWKYDWRAFAVRIAPVWPLLERVRVPVQVLRGEHSTVMPRDHFDRVLAGLPAASGADLRGLHHHLILDDPAACAAALRAFLLGESPSEAGSKVV